jgi:hypothetical protein
MWVQTLLLLASLSLLVEADKFTTCPSGHDTEKTTTTFSICCFCCCSSSITVHFSQVVINVGVDESELLDLLGGANGVVPVSVDLLPLSVSATAHAAVLSAIVNFGVDEFETIGANGVSTAFDLAHAAVSAMVSFP